ncbi:kinase-like protein [Dendrothele bispora CBS 962.96]|uniref:Kinase-like protein n=1 Tax=Dendrothele bispora (strain CBS 962.96) TaxID=1314807 RepID=A0A4S8LW46_DENBC|nr:kinase-like protein [Dendrothele bispora CBS 962.96]
MPTKPIDINGFSVSLIQSSLLSGDPKSGANDISVDADPQRYDSGRVFRIRFEWNPQNPTAAENEALQDDESWDLSVTALAQILPNLPMQSSILQAQTINGLFTVTSVEPLKLFFLPLPPDLQSIPQASINSLTCIKQLAENVDLVTMGKASTPLVFKHYPAIPDSYDPLLLEAQVFASVDSPYILKMKYVITDGGCFRGFLTPHHPYTLAKLLNDKTFPINWDLKIKWALSIAEGVAALHSHLAFCGDLRLENILISEERHLYLIDVGPLNGYCPPYIPPELDTEHIGVDFHQRTGPRDVYAVGIIFWAIATCNGWFGDDEVPRFGWKGDEDTPQWYVEMVNQCLATRPEARPSAEELAHRIRRL